jgi:hypothetical protein
MNTDERKEVVQLDKKRTLVDINKTAVNFQAEIIVVGKEFYCLICSQTDLDNSSEFPYKKYSGNFRQSIKVDDNVFQNYYLMMKADEPQNVQVMIRLHPLPKKQPSPQPPQPPQPLQQVPPQPLQQVPPQPLQQVPPQPQQQPEYIDQSVFSKSGIWKKVFWAAVILLALYLIYTFVICKKKPQVETQTPPSQIPSSTVQSQPELPSHQEKNLPSEGGRPGEFNFGIQNTKTNFSSESSKNNDRHYNFDRPSFSENIRKYKFVY